MITGSTRIYSTLGDPIHQVKAPQLINDIFARRFLDGVMVPMHILPKNLAQAFDGLRAMENFGGCVVTVPHKTVAPSLCDEITPEAKQVGAVNIIRRTSEGKLIGGILDGIGFVEGLKREGIEPRHQSVYMAGAGGAANAIAYALAASGVKKIVISNRSPQRALELITRLQKDYPSIECHLGTTDPSGLDLVINCTSLGLNHADAFPCDVEKLSPDQIVAEIIMKPVETPWLKIAKQKGCRIQYGLPMLECQILLMAEFMGLPQAITS